MLIFVIMSTGCNSNYRIFFSRWQILESVTIVISVTGPGQNPFHVFLHSLWLSLPDLLPKVHVSNSRSIQSKAVWMNFRIRLLKLNMTFELLKQSHCAAFTPTAFSFSRSHRVVFPQSLLVFLNFVSTLTRVCLLYSVNHRLRHQAECLFRFTVSS